MKGYAKKCGELRSVKVIMKASMMMHAPKKGPTFYKQGQTCTKESVIIDYFCLTEQKISITQWREKSKLQEQSLSQY